MDDYPAYSCAISPTGFLVAQLSQHQLTLLAIRPPPPSVRRQTASRLPRWMQATSLTGQTTPTFPTTTTHLTLGPFYYRKCVFFMPSGMKSTHSGDKKYLCFFFSLCVLLVAFTVSVPVTVISNYCNWF